MGKQAFKCYSPEKWNKLQRLVGSDRLIQVEGWFTWVVRSIVSLWAFFVYILYALYCMYCLCMYF